MVFKFPMPPCHAPQVAGCRASAQRLSLARCCGVAFALLASAVHASALSPELAASPASSRPIVLAVDATDLAHKVLHVRERLPVTAGPLTLLFPRWLPGQHSPAAALSQLAGLKMQTAGQPLDWLRDPLDTAAFQVRIPEGVAELQVEFDFTTPMSTQAERQTMTPEIVGLQWNTVVLYPRARAVDAIRVQPSLSLPAGWQLGSALDVAAQREGRFEFTETDLRTLVDSPVFAGRHLRRFDLDPQAPAAGRAPVFMTVVSDRPSQNQLTESQLAAHRALVQQADRLFASRHYARYEFLLAVSDTFGSIGLEHHQSSENGVEGSFLTDWKDWASERDLLPHEYTHAWNGKFRRPADQWTDDFNAPLQNSLLWVYEGQTHFWGNVLAARSGLVTRQEALDDLAESVAMLEARAGRRWRNLQDTTNDPVLRVQPGAREWRSWQRGLDFYGEGALLWLAADMRIRALSHDRRSLDDFARAFFGTQPQRCEPLAYSFNDVVQALDRVQPNDGAAFLRERLDARDAATPQESLNAAGWRLAWRDTPSDYLQVRMRRSHTSEFLYSLGLAVGRGGQLTQVLWDGPAFRAGVAPGAVLLAVNGLSYTDEVLKEAIVASAAPGAGAPIELLLKAGDRYLVVPVAWSGGLRYPVLERIPNTPDRLSKLLAPLP